MRVLPLTTAIAVAARLWRGQSIRLTTYCIENNDFRSLVGYAGPLSKPLTRMVIALIGKVIAPRLDRVVYGSEGSETTYGTIPQMALVLSRVVPELPDARQLIPANARGALFVGRLESRKGVIQLLEAWSKIEGQTDHHLTLVGDGPLMADVQAWVAENPNRRRAVGQLSRNDTEMNYLNHRILVAPSVREGRWREQVGLPIVEALSHGLTVVTTCETGIAGWLLRNGHTVIEQSSELADAILARLREPLEPSEVAAALPLVGGRKIADDWMRSRDGR